MQKFNLNGLEVVFKNAKVMDLETGEVIKITPAEIFELMEEYAKQRIKEERARIVESAENAIREIPSKKRIRVTDEQKQEIKKLWERGIEIKNIAKRLGLSYPVVYQWVRRFEKDNKLFNPVLNEELDF